ncbi:hypothetical protein EST38_g6245 [Candolleomyces aberdarensis]|uniref:Uncharacterized protein n=1 Tax=Candolleomyces aberdarensis TaxID=2316362 RepID=A0A4V1Q3S5_9AGAR|nr:hypothetical protein EST38_g6245 [Candolleomyces aberdarensis]
MDLHHQEDQGSPFIRDIGLVPPSPELSSSARFDSVLEFPNNPLGSPQFIDNSGSYHNSPYSGHSELSFVTAENDLSFELFSGDEAGTGLFDPIHSAGIAATNEFDYDPAEYDPPHSGSSLMMYPDNDYMSPPPAFDGVMGSASPDHQQQFHHRSGSVPYDYSSPSSNNGEDNNDRRSRASSVSSAQNKNQYYQSPRLEVAQSFENMTVRSPSWGAQQLPQAQQPKAPSPPRLVMPNEYQIDGQDPPPTINAPEGDDMDGGPQLHIVPATPIGMVGGSAAGAPFQNPMDTLNQGPNQSSWGVGVTEQSDPSGASTSRQSSPFRFPARGPNDNTVNQGLGFNTIPAVNNSNANAPFLFPQQQRVRSKSDNALEPPSWNTTLAQQQLRQQGDSSVLGLDLAASSNGAVDDTALGTGSSTTSTHGNPSTSAGYQMHGFAFGGSGGNTDYLSPDFSMRRSKSENGNARQFGHRQSRSEDIRGLQPSLQLPQQHHQQQTFIQHSNPSNSFHHGHSLSLSASQGQLLFPPDLMPSQPNPHLLSTNTLPPSVLRSSSPARGHIRRASSGSRAGRGIGAESWAADYGTAGGSARASPYPSPNASPMPRYSELELDLNQETKYEIPEAAPSAGFENDVALSGRMTLSANAKHQQAQQNMLDVKGFINTASNLSTIATEATLQQVSKPNVTTLRTANASHKRRKQEASFVCPFPGCGMLFEEFVY